MKNIKAIEDKVKDLMAECHEHGMQYVISIMDRDKGDTINAIEGNGSTAIVMLGMFVQKIVEKTEAPLEEILDHVRMAAEAAIEVDKESEE